MQNKMNESEKLFSLYKKLDESIKDLNECILLLQDEKIDNIQKIRINICIKSNKLAIELYNKKINEIILKS